MYNTYYIFLLRKIMDNRRNDSLRYLREAHTVLAAVTASANESSIHVLNTITKILDSAWITESSLHNENIRPFITAIHTLFMRDTMKARIESILRNPTFIILDSRIKIIYSGSYLIENPAPVSQQPATKNADDVL